MTKIFCDRCETEIKGLKTMHTFDFPQEWSGCLCEDCYKAFESFMKMENSMYHTNRDILHNPGSNHGIERMTFGSR